MLEVELGDGTEDLMWLDVKPLALLALGVGAAALVGALPIAAASPFAQNTQEGAAGVIADLEAQGYNVVINWLTGYDTKPLTRCRVTQINNPGNVAPSPDTFVTVYVDVQCPNNDDEGFIGGIGVGVG